jgi:subtilisin-like proprotein convertase family protein/Ca2+-binding EF-hand superfamily protein
MMQHLHRSTRIALVVTLICCHGATVWGQAGLRESLERLDRNTDGLISPEEITPLARPYLERILKSRSRGRGVSFDRPIEISRIQEAARLYYAVQNGIDDDNVRPEGESSVKPFGPEEDVPLVPGFGIGEIRFPYTPEDVEQARETMQRCDRDGDGFINRQEAGRNRWTHRNPFDDDLDKDDRISLMELTQRYARRRLLDEGVDELSRKAQRLGSEVRPSAVRSSREDSSRWWRRGGSDFWLTASMLGRFDRNRNGRLEAEEAQRLGMPIGRIDLDRDGEISRDELQAVISELQDEAGDVTEGLPGWFFELDTNRDGQVAMHEFAEPSEWSQAKHAEFDAMDLNTDGLLTSSEVLRAAAIVGGSYRNETAEVLPPRRTIISEIEIEDDYPIDELTLELSITHSSTGSLDGYLTGPEGDRVELFTEVGDSGDHFDQTRFDDSASKSISKGRPPFEGSYRPEAIDKKQPGLRQFRGKNIKGVWQLVIRGTRSDRFGMLHSWGLNIKPQEYDPIAAAAAAGDTDPRKAPDQQEQSTSSKKDDVRTEKAADGKAKKPATEEDSSKGSLLDLIRSELGGGSL